MTLRDKLLAEFRGQFGDTGEIFHFKAPGRVNLIGEHTDYNDGLVLPFGIDRYVHFSARRRRDHRMLLYSMNFAERKELKLDALSRQEGGWSDYIQGILCELLNDGYKIGGFEGAIYGNIPMGAGLGSSAALEIAVAYGLSRLFSFDIPGLELVKLCQKAENNFVGANCGIMDQYVSCYARRGKALFLDTRSLTHQFVDLPLQDVGILVIDTGVKHTLASSEYNKRREECEEGVRLLQAYLPSLRTLRDLSPTLFTHSREKLPTRLQKRVEHVLEENLRVKRTVEALTLGDMRTVGQLLFASHESLKNLYEVSSPKLDFLVDLAHESQVLGARMTGGGFGGSTIHLLFKEQILDYCIVVKKEFRNEFGLEPRILEIKTSAGVEEDSRTHRVA